MKVKIKTWDKMKEEYGTLNWHSIILTRCWFSITQEKLLPRSRVIEIEDYDRKHDYIIGYWKGWLIDIDMVERIYADDSLILEE